MLSTRLLPPKRYRSTCTAPATPAALDYRHKYKHVHALLIVWGRRQLSYPNESSSSENDAHHPNTPATITITLTTFWLGRLQR